MKKDKEKIYTKTALKREYGCTDKMFEYLPEADKIWYGRYKGQRWDAWSQAKVDEFLAKPEVIALLEKKKKQSANRKAAAKKAVETRKKRDLAEVKNMKITVRKVSEKTLRKHAQEYIMWNYDDLIDITERELVNTIRHEFTSYEEDLDALFGRFGQVELQKYIYQRTYNKIMEVYPEYKDEIKRQLEEHLDRFWGE
ncbi:hypothetical protein [Ligilactobacillus salivarius]|uniref:hypothetical protein n=1 Tax=Ligilactobacillus salivarius TaxID=1624 RepID=UPI0021514B44|nr:hypothetical protein [Ligilactobacillus salivarius]MDH4960095.1 hypothetical protein [Ligilactobacillus salivarius]UUY24361.1 hypothetical protein NUU06_10225 [Ligilactobacillus salivarius]